MEFKQPVNSTNVYVIIMKKGNTDLCSTLLIEEMTPEVSSAAKS